MARGGKREGAGRPAGALDKGNADLRQMILQALDRKGGVDYLEGLAGSNSAAFVSLLRSVMPKEVVGAGGKDLFPSRIVFEVVDP